MSRPRALPRLFELVRSVEPTGPLLVGGAAVYLIVINWAISNLGWDLWGALIYAPLLTLATILLARRMFAGELQPVVAAIVVGFVVKVAGAMARYWVAFTAYGGASDSVRYHETGSLTASLFWSGQIDLWTLVPTGSNTIFVDGVAGLVYSFIGTSQLAAYVVFAWFGYVGVMCFIKAACVSVPGLAQRRYAWLCVLMPSIVYWPASLGKESLMMFGLGLGSLGVARLFERGGFLRGLVLTLLGFGFVGYIRPHIAGGFIAGVLPGLMVAFRRPAAEDSAGAPKRNRFVLFLAISVALVAVVFVASLALAFLEPSQTDGEEASGGVGGITAILEETTRRSEIGGSSFQPPSITNPLMWPYAVVRTLTRPLPFEASGLFQLISAAEMSVLLGMCAYWWRPLRGLRRSVVRIPYITYSMVVLFMGGLVYTSFANLGILTRQKSLLLPLMLLLPCLPSPPERRPSTPRDREAGSSIPARVGVS
jgi:hypothetical protein